MEENALWHKISEKEKEEIKKSAKKILDEFASKLEKIKVEECLFEKGEGLRQEGEPWKSEKDFIDLIFSNAPLVEDNSIVAEKGGWK
jgi:Asp-tRNA(Asn)/Glu-tRNA(Gln) amidotransferase C subunit